MDVQRAHSLVLVMPPPHPLFHIYSALYSSITEHCALFALLHQLWLRGQRNRKILEPSKPRWLSLDEA